MIASIQPTHAYVLIYIYPLHGHTYTFPTFLPSASVTCGMLKIGLFVFFFVSEGSSLHFLQGPERVKRLYAFRSLIDSGARITLGSDFPVESINPLSAFYAAVTRRSPDGKSPHGPGGWYLSLCEALTFISFRNYIGSQNND